MERIQRILAEKTEKGSPKIKAIESNPGEQTVPIRIEESFNATLENLKELKEKTKAGHFKGCVGCCV